MRLRIALAMGVLFVGASASALAAQAPVAGQESASPSQAVIGSVKTVKGEVFIVRSGQRVAAERGSRLYAGDVLLTGKNAALGVVLHDETGLSLGPSSELALKEFAFKPNEGIFASVLSIVRGTMVYISGRIATLAPDAVRVETPVGVAAIRGTKVLIKIDQ